MTWALYFLLAALAAPSRAEEYDPRSKPRFDYYPGAFLVNTQIVEHNSLTLYSKLDQEPPEMAHITGDSRQVSYRVKNVSPEKIFLNYQQALRSAGFTIQYQCADERCGRRSALRDAAKAFREIPPLDKQPHYLIARSEEAGVPVTFALLASTNNVSDNAFVVTTYIEETPLETGLVVAAKNYLPMKQAKKRPAAQPPHKDDHPLLPRYPESISIALTKTDYGSLDLPKASLETPPESDPLRGQLHQAIYQMRDVSAEKVYLNYKFALTQAGFTVATLCEPDGCPVKTQLSAIAAKLYPGQSSRGHHGYYLKGERGPVQLGLLVSDAERKGTAYVRQAIIEVEDLETGLIEITSDEIAQQVQHTGKALIYGIYFDTGKSVIKPESKSAFEAIHGFLKANPNMDFYVVGHTDDTGELQSNLGLSRNRAAAVVKELVDSYGISAKRLTPQGVGPFAPAAANQTDSGRTQNRRVELVWRLAP